MLAAVMAAVVWVGCDQPPEIGDVSALPVHVPPVRAVEVVDDAHFLVAPPPPPEPEILRTFDFNNADAVLERWTVEEKNAKRYGHHVGSATDGWDSSLGLRVGPLKSKAPSLCVPVSSRVPVGAGGRYQVTTRVRTDGISGTKMKAGAGLEVVALSGTAEEPEVESRHLTSTRYRGTTNGWETLTITVDAERGTQALEINLLRCSGRGAGNAVFDELTVAGVPQEAAALDAPEVSPVHRAESHPLVRRLNPDDDYRPGIITLTPSTWVMRVDRSQDAQLLVGFGVDKRSHRDARVCFRIDDSEDGLLVRRCVGPTDVEIKKDGEGWVDTALELPARAEASTLVFSATAEGAPDGVSAIGYWGNPRVIPVERTASQAEKPDVVLFIFDTTRRDHLGFGGYDLRPTSPGLDAFAATAWDFSQASAPAGWTLPSGSTIITGRYPMTHGGGWRVRRDVQALKVSDVQKKHARTLDFTSIADDIPTLAEQMRSAGYRTTMIASNHFLSPDFGFGEGFDRHAQYGGSSVQGGEKAGSIVHRLLEREPLGEGEPLFLVVHFIDPHIPYRYRTPGRARWDPPDDLEFEHESYRGRKTLKVKKLNNEMRDKPESLLNLYDADIAHVDGVFADLIGLVGDAGVIVTADHGEEFDDHGYFEHGHHVWQALIHVPLLVRPPGVKSDPRSIDAAASIADVYPTILGWAGIDPGDVDGKVLDPAEVETWGDRLVWIEHQYLGPERTGYRNGYQKVVYSLQVGWIDSRVTQRRDPLTNGKMRTGSSPPVKSRYPVEAGGLVYDIATDAAEMEPRTLTPNDPLLAPIAERIRDRFPGLHVECARPSEEPITLTFASDVALVRLSPLSLSFDDKVDIPGDHRSVTVTLTPGAEPESTSLGTTPWFVLEAVDHGVVNIEGALPEGCRSWLNDHRGGSVDLDEESQQMLEDLGYMGH